MTRAIVAVNAGVHLRGEAGVSGKFRGLVQGLEARHLAGYAYAVAIHGTILAQLSAPPKQLGSQVSEI
jgi:hypothetical protein